MNTRISPLKGYLLVAMIGAVGSVTLFALAKKVIPKMVSDMMSTMMRQKMGQMSKNGFDPTEMCEKMMKGFGDSQSEEKPDSQVE
jgi:hypothetical protein